MCPTIRKFPSFVFYEDKIEDSQVVKSRGLDAAMKTLADHLSRVVFFDLCKSREEVKDFSRINLIEAEFAYNLVKTLYDLTSDTMQSKLKGKIGLVTPYKG